MRETGGIGIYGILSICLFFVVFTSALIWAFLLRKPFLHSMSRLPLDSESSPTQPKGGPRHE